MLIGIVDIETTGFLPKGKIVEIGIVSLDTETGAIEPVYGTVCREPGLTAKDRNAWIFENSDLTQEEVRTAPDFATVVKRQVQGVLGAFDAVTAFNKKFDFDYLRNRGVVIGEEWPCLMLRAMPLCKLKSKKVYANYKWPNVEEAWHHFFPNTPYVEAHRGPDDAIHEAKIAYELYKLGAML